jgi:MFS family permease
MVLILPFGVVSGYTTVTLAYQLREAGVAVAAIAALSAWSMLPQTWKFFWGPVVDITLDQRKWYLISVALSAVGLGAMGFFPPTRAGLAMLTLIAFLASLATTFLGMACESLIAHTTPDELRGRVAGWYQAGNLGGAGIGGGLGLELAQHLPAPWMASVIVAGLCLLSSIALLWSPPPEKAFAETGVLRKLRETAKDVSQIVRQRAGLLALILCFLPIGTGAAPLAAIAGEWKASDHIVAIVTGVLGGIVSAIGCFVGGWLCDRIDRKDAYVWFGIFQAASGVALGVLTRNEWMFVIGTLIYTFGSGLTYAAFSAFVLEAIGKGAAATKYNVLASLSNAPIYFVTLIDGWSHDKWNSAKMFYVESGMAAVSALVFLILARILWPNRAAKGS